MGVAQTTPDKFLLVLCTPEKRIPESLSFHHFPRHTRFPSLLSEFCKSGPFAAGHLAASGSSRFTPLAELKATEKIKGENRRNLLAVQFLRDRGLKIRLDPSPSFSSPSPSILVFSTVFRSLSSARFAVSFLEADDSIPPSR